MLRAAVGWGRGGRAILADSRGAPAIPHPCYSPLPASAPSPRLLSRTIRDLCWRPREPRSWLAEEEATSWIPECEVCRKALSFGDGRDPAVSMALDKQEETVRESRYFTALKAYKHGARGRKSRSLSSKPERPAAPGAGAGAGNREPGARAGNREPEPGTGNREPETEPEPGAGSREPERRGSGRAAPGLLAGSRARAAGEHALGRTGPRLSLSRGAPSPHPLQMQREAAFRPGHCLPLRIMGSVDQGKPLAFWFSLFLSRLPALSLLLLSGSAFSSWLRSRGRPRDCPLLGAQVEGQGPRCPALAKEGRPGRGGSRLEATLWGQ